MAFWKYLSSGTQEGIHAWHCTPVQNPSMAEEGIGPERARPTAVVFAVVVNNLLSSCLLNICVFIPQYVLLLPWKSGFSFEFLIMLVKEF